MTELSLFVTLLFHRACYNIKITLPRQATEDIMHTVILDNKSFEINGLLKLLCRLYPSGTHIWINSTEKFIEYKKTIMLMWPLLTQSLTA